MDDLGRTEIAEKEVSLVTLVNREITVILVKESEKEVRKDSRAKLASLDIGEKMVKMVNQV